MVTRWKEAGDPFTRADLQMLSEAGVETLWAPREASGALARFLAARLNHALSSRGHGHIKTRQALVQALLLSVAAVLDAPGAPEHRLTLSRLVQIMVRSFDIHDVARLIEPESADFSLAGHSVAVGLWCFILVDQLSLAHRSRQRLVQAALLHDLGLSLVPDEGTSLVELEGHGQHPMVREHTDLGVTLMMNSGPITVQTRDAVLYHHERLDGSGYPFGLRGSSIPMTARIVGLADVLAREAFIDHQSSHESLTRGFGSRLAARAAEVLRVVTFTHRSGTA